VVDAQRTAAAVDGELIKADISLFSRTQQRIDALRTTMTCRHPIHSLNINPRGST